MSTLSFVNSQIVNATNSIQAVSSNLTIANSIFSEITNDASTNFIFLNLGSILVMNSTSFLNSTSSMMKTRSSKIFMTNITISKVYNSSELWRISSSNQIEISSVKFEDLAINSPLFLIEKSTNVVLTQFSGSGVNNLLVQITSSEISLIDSFTINQFDQGIVIKQSTVNLISNSNFTSIGGNSIKIGGAIYFLDCIATISKSVFTNNTALSGGAIGFECSNLNQWVLNISNSTFELNTAITQGGAIYYSYNRPTLQSIFFTKNKAGYGANIASYPIKIKMIDSSGGLMTLNNMVSGKTYESPIQLSLVDFDEQVMILNNINQILISSINRNLISLKGVSTALVRNGIATFTNVIANAVPGSSNIFLQASSKAIDSSKVKEVYKTVNENLISVNFRYCEPGEIQTNDNICSSWASGTYSLKWNSTECTLCPQNAVWLGDIQIYVESGYWRKSSNTSTLVQCINAKACKGGFVNQEIAPVECEVGYTGILWSDWDIFNGTKYEKVSDTTCQKCPSPAMNTIRVAGMIILVFVFITWIIVVNIRKTQESEMSILLRIITNYLQLISWMMSFNIKFPSVLTDIFSPFKDVGSSTEVFLSFDWFVTNYDLKGPFGSNRIFKIFLTAFLPILLLIIFTIIWTVLWLISKKIVSSLQRNIIISFISIMFLLHPRLVQNSFVIFEWVKVDQNDNRALVNIEISCFSNEHIKWMAIIAIPILIIWVISIPLIALILLWKNYK